MSFFCFSFILNFLIYNNVLFSLFFEHRLFEKGTNFIRSSTHLILVFSVANMAFYEIATFSFLCYFVLKKKIHKLFFFHSRKSFVVGDSYLSLSFSQNGFYLCVIQSQKTASRAHYAFLDEFIVVLA